MLFFSFFFLFLLFFLLKMVSYSRQPDMDEMSCWDREGTHHERLKLCNKSSSEMAEIRFFFLSLLRAIDLATKQKEEKGRSFRNRRLMQHTGVIVETEESEMESPNSGDINRKSGVHASDTGESVDHHPFPILLAFTKTEILGTIPSSFRFSSLNLSFLLYFFISFYFFKNAIRDVTRFSEHAHYS